LLLIIRKKKRLNFFSFNILISAIVIIDLYLFVSDFIRQYEFDKFSKKQIIASKLHHYPFQGRVVAYDHLYESNDGLTFRFPSIIGYDPLILGRYVDYILSSQDYYIHRDHVIDLTGIRNPKEKLIRMLNVRQAVLNGNVFNLDNEIPYANIVCNAVIKPSDEILPFMKSDEFDPQRMVVFEEQYRSKLLTQREEGGCKGIYSILEYSEENIRIKVSIDSPGYMVLSEIAYPGWKAEVDGKRVPILSGNYIFRVIPLGEGEHEIDLYFVSWPFYIGLYISLITLIGSFWLIRPGRRF